jgi:hypothetical protein
VDGVGPDIQHSKAHDAHTKPSTERSGFVS